jgi:hypothetical protein
MITDLATSFGGPVLEDLGKKAGLPPEIIKQAAPIVIALVVGAVARMAKQPGGLNQLTGLFDAAGKERGSADLDSFVKNVDPAKSGDLLKALAGGNSIENVADNLSRKTGIPAEAVAGLLGTMAPAVLSQASAIAKEQGLDTAGLVNLIGEKANAMPDAQIADYILDDVPGISDDIKRGFKKLFG